ncbi:bifunctional class I SAM-dependent methyltransferase/GNAT family N-acetyltransferase [Ideonella sp. A 288]|uniref:bifunctional class I SAM-dependent methyltransferase/GNAT family N-acetyltransferase n=1 Tax=Ideonella sp. A 288 TaxID=1962181 RepID=UPI000B4AE2F8|nr:bifunctional class I SAM-dependent methyltransferase/GNAT family N-acetyltransferase [Ideonella sp. A 288]
MTVKDFSFPLNVFARLLEMQEGRVEYLHFPTFESADEPVLQAQERASRHLWQALPPPGRLLEVGIGLGTTLARLSAAGYRAMGITPEAAQVAEVRRRHGPLVEVMESRLEDFAHEAGQWDALLFQESAQYIDPLALFDAAERLLHGGRTHLVVMDEFALRRSDAAHTGLHEIGAFCDLAARHGWRLVHRTELSAQAAPTLDYLLRGVRARRDDLMADLSLDAATMDGLEAALTRSQTLYREGVYGYALLRFEREQPSADRPVRLGGAQAGAVRTLFERIFGHPLSAEEWAWKYGDGRGHAVGLVRPGRVPPGGDGAEPELLSHYGGLSRRVIFHGEPVLACQVCDVMVDARARTALARGGPLQRTTATFLDEQIGWGKPHRIGFGFPTDRAMAAAEHLGLYTAVDEMVCAAWPASSAGTGVGTVAQPLEAADLADGGEAVPVIDGLWRDMAAALPQATLGVRDAAWLRHRYLGHPRFRYELWLLRRRLTRRPIGVAVLRRHEQHLEWVDAVAPPAAWGALLAVARQRAAVLGAPMVEAWITQSQQHLMQALAPQDIGLRPLGIRVPANAHSPGPDADAHRGRWLLMAGDTDFR